MNTLLQQKLETTKTAYQNYEQNIQSNSEHKSRKSMWDPKPVLGTRGKYLQYEYLELKHSSVSEHKSNLSVNL